MLSSLSLPLSWSRGLGLTHLISYLARDISALPYELTRRSRRTLCVLE